MKKKKQNFKKQNLLTKTQLLTIRGGGEDDIHNGETLPPER